MQGEVEAVLVTVAVQAEQGVMAAAVLEVVAQGQPQELLELLIKVVEAGVHIL
jgi:hypothetical protein